MMTYVPLDTRLVELKRRILRAFPEQFDITNQSFMALGGIGSDMHRLVLLAMRQSFASRGETDVRGINDARAIASVVEELLGRCERTIAEYAELDAWMETEHAKEVGA